MHRHNAPVTPEKATAPASSTPGPSTPVAKRDVIETFRCSSIAALLVGPLAHAVFYDALFR